MDFGNWIYLFITTPVKIRKIFIALKVPSFSFPVSPQRQPLSLWNCFACSWNSRQWSRTIFFLVWPCEIIYFVMHVMLLYLLPSGIRYRKYTLVCYLCPCWWPFGLFWVWPIVGEAVGNINVHYMSLKNFWVTASLK